MAEKTREDIVSTIQKCFALADDPAATPAERELAFERARDLMAKFTIEDIELSAAKGSEDSIIFAEIRITIQDVESGETRGEIPDQRILLAHYIARNTHCKCVITNKGIEYDVNSGKPTGQPGTFMVVVGYSHDVQLVRSLYQALQQDMMMQMWEEPGYLLAKKVSVKKEFAMNFGDRYAVRINQRLGAMSQAVDDVVSSVSNSMALAVIDRKTKVEQFFDQMYPPKSLRSQHVASFGYNESARRRGEQAANIADLGAGKLGGGSKGGIGTAKKELR